MRSGCRAVRTWSGVALFACLVAAPVQAETRSLDGSGNQLANPDAGATHTPLLRIVPPDYGDGISTPAGSTRPSARAISQAVSAQSGPMPSSVGLSNWFWAWGQFLDHDIDLTGAADPPEPFDIAVPSGDPWFDPGHTGTATIGLDRSLWDANSGTGASHPRQQLNEITAWIDASMVYGSDATRAAELRALDGTGRLRTSAGDLLPFNDNGFENAMGTSSHFFLAGDVRANENVALTAIHTVFLREHNRLVAELAAADPGLDGETLYQTARRWVGAEIQAVTVQEFLPVLLGAPLSPYAGYDENVDPSIANLFSTAAFRFGHSMLPSQLLRLDASGDPIAEGHLALRDAFFAPHRITDEGGIEPLLHGLMVGQAQEIDAFVIDEVRNFLFGPPGSGGFDLVSLNLQRGRDHGLPSFNDARLALGLPAVGSFAELTDDPLMQDVLENLYGGISALDAWLGGLLEAPEGDALVGELFETVIRDQFERLRDGDRFWYENDFTPEEIAELEATRLYDIVTRNTDVHFGRANLFFTPEPGTALLLATGLFGLALSRRRRSCG